MNAFEFMSTHPILTFFLACIASSSVCGLFHSFTVLVHGHPPHEDKPE